MWKKTAQIIGKIGKETVDTISKSLDFIDDALEKEAITGTLQSIKDATGKIVQDAGTLFEKSKQRVENRTSEEYVHNAKEQAQEIADELKTTTQKWSEEGKKWAQNMRKDENVQQTVSKLKKFGEDLTSRAEEMASRAENMFNKRGKGEEE